MFTEQKTIVRYILVSVGISVVKVFWFIELFYICT